MLHKQNIIKINETQKFELTNFSFPIITKHQK